jgi:hypothetical protein
MWRALFSRNNVHFKHGSDGLVHPGESASLANGDTRGAVRLDMAMSGWLAGFGGSAI